MICIKKLTCECFTAVCHDKVPRATPKGYRDESDNKLMQVK